MVKISSSGQPKKSNMDPRWKGWLWVVSITSFLLYFGLPPFIELDQDGNYILSKERQMDYQEKLRRSEGVEVYRLVAIKTGLYQCLRCPGIKAIQLKAGEVWKYGISRNGRSRYPENFYLSNHVDYQRITKTDILGAEQLEKELIIAYPLLPESQFRMKQYGIFLKRPPGNAKDH